MAALNRRIPNLDDFVGLNWSCWADRVNVLPSDAQSHVEDSSMCGGSRHETMTLSKEDMHTYGHCPSHDDFYLVVCNHCGQVVKPEAFEKHCVRRHEPLTKMCGQLSTLAPQQRPRPGKPPSNLSSSRERQKEGRHQEENARLPAVLPVHPRRPSKAQREAASLPSTEKFLQEIPPHQHHSSPTPRPRVPPWHSGPLPPGPCSTSTAPSEKPTVQKVTAGQTSESHSPLRGTRTYSQIHKNIEKKECDLNKHCQVVDPERKKLVSRELMYNTDSIHQQQKAVGRAKTFDQLAVEQRAGRDVEQLLIKLKDKEQNVEAFEEKTSTQGNKYNFSNNCRILRSRDPQEEEGDSTVEVNVQPPYPFNQSLLSSEESEDDDQEEATDLSASPWHPKPLGLCTFGCRTLGYSIFTFDRRFHHLQFALSAMLERHVSTHLWKKVPQVPSGIRSCHVISPQTVRTVARPSQFTGSLSLESTSLGQLETKSNQHNSQITRPPSSTSSANLRPGRWANPAGRQIKAQLKEHMQDTCTAQKATRLPHSNEGKSSRHIRDPPLHKKGQPRTPSSQGPITLPVSHGKKPCPPLPLQPTERHLSSSEKRSPLPAITHSSPRGREWPPGIQPEVVYNHKGRGQKRKSNKGSPPLSSSVSRTSKCKRLSSPSRSGLVTWKGENIGACLEKRSNS